MKTKSVLYVLKATKRIAFWSAALTGLALSGLAQTTVAHTVGYKIEETLLGPWNLPIPVNQSDDFPTFALSSDRLHIVYASSCNVVGKSQTCIFVDGHSTLALGKVAAGSLALSPDGKRVAYAVKSGKRWALVVDGHVGVENDEVGQGSLTFSPDGKHLAYAARIGNRWREVMDGQPGEEYENVSGPVFSPDGKHVAYRAQPNRSKWTVVVDGRPGDDYDNITGPIFSPDSKHIAYVTRTNGTWKLKPTCSLVVDGHEIAEYMAISGLSFSPDGQRLVFAALQRLFSKSTEIVDDLNYEAGNVHIVNTTELGTPGYLGTQYSGLSPTASFSPDGKRIAYMAETGLGQYSVVADGMAGPGFHGVGVPVFSTDGKHMAYAAVMEPEKIKKNNLSSVNNSTIVLDGQSGARYMSILDGSLAFSPDGTLEFLALDSDNPSRGVTILLGTLSLHIIRVKYIPVP
jgi:Tol biopolymer transport system component